MKVSREETSNLFSYNVMNFPSKSCGLVSLINLENELSNASGLSCGIFNQTTENIVFLLDKNLSVKSQSLVTNTLCSDLENSANFPFESPLGFEIISNPCCLRNTSNLFFTFSSLGNLGFEGDTELDIISASGQISSILQSCQDVFFIYSWVVIEDFINAHSSVEHFQNLPDHNSCSFEGGLSMTDFTICDNIIINFNSHKINNDEELYKHFETAWLKATELNIGDGIAVPDYETNEVKWEKITSIKQYSSQHVYDLMIEDTHNFIANDIIAHNTYLGDSTADTVAIAGNLSVDSSVLFVDSNNDRVGIGTTSPDGKLHAMVASAVKLLHIRHQMILLF